MNPSLDFIQTVNAALTDPNVRASVTQMHADRVPLLQMIEALGLEEDMPPHIRDVVANLPAPVVDGIRRATLGMLEASAAGTVDKKDAYKMPLDCSVSADAILAGAEVDVSVVAAKITIVAAAK